MPFPEASVYSHLNLDASSTNDLSRRKSNHRIFLLFVITDRAIGMGAGFLLGDFRLCDDFGSNNPGNTFNLHSPLNEPETVSKSLRKVVETHQTLPVQLPCTNG